MTRSTLAAVLTAMVACSGAAHACLPAPHVQPGVSPRNSKPHGQSYEAWSAAWWAWAMSQPLTGHPFIDSPDFQVSSGQSGQVWFLGAPFGTVTRDCTIPPGKALFVGILNAEWSSLEQPGATYEDEKSTVEGFFALIDDVYFILDTVPVRDISQYHVESPQFTFTAPTPWIFGTPDNPNGGTGTSVGDGYYVFLEPLSVGAHTLQYGGIFHLTDENGNPLDVPLDMTYNLTVAP